MEFSLDDGIPTNHVSKRCWGNLNLDQDAFSKNDSMLFKKQGIRQSESESQPSNKVVEIEALVLIKIMRHCREHFPTPVNGLLVGLDNEQVLEVTDCFGLQNKRDLWNQLSKEKYDSKEVDEKVALEDTRYQLKMFEQLPLVHADCCNVGWYQSLQFDDLKEPSIIEGLCEHQEFVRDAVVIGYDPQLAFLGLDAFKAYRVTNEILKCRAEAEQSDVSMYNLFKGRNVLVEAPLVVKNILLNQAFLTDWLHSDKQLQQAGEWEAFNASNRNLFIQKRVDFISSCLDDLQVEQEKLMRYHRETARQNQKQKEIIERRRLENEQRRLKNEDLLMEIFSFPKKPDPPNQLTTLLISNHVNRVTRQLTESINDNLAHTNLISKQFSLQNSNQ